MTAPNFVVLVSPTGDKVEVSPNAAEKLLAGGYYKREGQQNNNETKQTESKKKSGK